MGFLLHGCVQATAGLGGITERATPRATSCMIVMVKIQDDYETFCLICVQSLELFHAFPPAPWCLQLCDASEYTSIVESITVNIIEDCTGSMVKLVTL